MLTFHYEPDFRAAALPLAERLQAELQANEPGLQKNVVWIVSGGSNIVLSVSVLHVLHSKLQGKLKGDLARLTILLGDERYGKPGHADSNWQQLAVAGFAKAAEASGAKFLTVLQPAMTLDDTCEHYGQVVHSVFDQADVIIAQLGIGGDGHIAGILPRSAAVGSQDQVAGYDSGTYQRITMTPPALLRATAAYVYAYGDTKHQALEKLQSQELSIGEQPAQILKQLSEAHLYTDQKAD